MTDGGWLYREQTRDLRHVNTDGLNWHIPHYKLNGFYLEKKFHGRALMFAP